MYLNYCRTTVLDKQSIQSFQACVMKSKHHSADSLDKAFVVVVDNVVSDNNDASDNINDDDSA